MPGELTGGGATENISYWLKLPDQTGNYEVKTEIHDGETELEEVSLDVDVSQAVLSRIINTVVELEALDVSYLRLKAGDIMVIMGRRLYEEVKQWGSSRLNPFTGLITAD
ncbi:MAG: hypothetical protein NT166_24490 [Candidatus Aminicenantes bacterium]|nr:hypothetical protein [Candidatus Aminicenantes bacterium]